MSAPELLLTGIALLALGVVIGIAACLREVRQAKQRWLTMPGAVDTSDPRDMASEVFDWQAYDGWSVRV